MPPCARGRTEPIQEAKVYRRIASDAMTREQNLPKLIVELGCGRGRDAWAIRGVLNEPVLSFVCAEANSDSLELARALVHRARAPLST